MHRIKSLVHKKRVVTATH